MRSIQQLVVATRECCEMMAKTQRVPATFAWPALPGSAEDTESPVRLARQDGQQTAAGGTEDGEEDEEEEAE